MKRMKRMSKMTKKKKKVSPVLCYFVPFHTAVQGMFQESGERKSLGTF